MYYRLMVCVLMAWRGARGVGYFLLVWMFMVLRSFLDCYVFGFWVLGSYYFVVFCVLGFVGLGLGFKVSF